jgi:hypothetical protein
VHLAAPALALPALSAEPDAIFAALELIGGHIGEADSGLDLPLRHAGSFTGIRLRNRDGAVPVSRWPIECLEQLPAPPHGADLAETAGASDHPAPFDFARAGFPRMGLWLFEYPRDVAL